MMIIAQGKSKYPVLFIFPSFSIPDELYDPTELIWT